jgi:hypothetical protein
MLRKSAISAVAVASSVALLVVGAPTASQAFTQKELTVCYNNTVPNSIQDLEVVADGPSYKTTTLDSGDCSSADVRPGQYKLTVEDVVEFLYMLYNEDYCNGYTDHGQSKPYPNIEIVIRRMGGETYKAFNYAAIANGEVTTNVKKNRSTSATVNVFCDDDELNFPDDIDY